MVPKVVYDETNETDDNAYDSFTLEEYLFIKGLLIEKYYADVDEGILLKDWFASEITIADWADFFREYDVFSIRQRKDWTNKHIRLVRYLIKSATI